MRLRGLPCGLLRGSFQLRRWVVRGLCVRTMACCLLGFWGCVNISCSIKAVEVRLRVCLADVVGLLTPYNVKDVLAGTRSLSGRLCLRACRAHDR